MVIRELRIPCGPSFGIRHKRDRLFVSADELVQGDEIVDPNEIELRDLRVTHPEEVKQFYGHLFKDGEPIQPPEDPASAPRSLVLLDWKDAVRCIRQTDDVDALARWYEDEMERDPAPRPSVLAALEEKGMK
ncbi:MAG: hypothetical protein EP301_13285 [Gammaproteobacteria bacterium]|nr:MAG: hypothetical protein EP301_13285 [Gammaproteobacteria bacterium]